MTAILVQNDLKKIVTGQKLTNSNQSNCDELDEKALSEVLMEKTTSTLWSKLESLYMTKDKLSFEDVKGNLLNKYKLDNELGSNSKAIEKNKKGKQKAEVIDVSVAKDKGDYLLLVSTIERSKLTSEWVLDSRCSYHMCSDKDWFSTYSPVKGEVVLMGNNSPCKIIGIGIIQIKMHNRIIRTLSNVRHVPNLKKNIISLGILDLNGCKIVIKPSNIKGSTVTGATTIMEVEPRQSPRCDERQSTDFWHMQLGHMSDNGMTILNKKGFLSGPGVGNLDFREHCVFGKQT
ncbi:Retrovirus-related Pol polyprotein from transposon TNT 1-94 [Gossypium australe]|uniref:Retrovirus-related Pol polyprotein from transposon TNT 1-94 n=1 Tax=Gossypium australe TaxID=47621 RepID=A0A5B6X134_9ROSI|nr:Retrovirus-related Pol polyprotein from transposon TNT 1-94 [Gossypium australe]